MPILKKANHKAPFERLLLPDESFLAQFQRQAAETSMGPKVATLTSSRPLNGPFRDLVVTLRF